MLEKVYYSLPRFGQFLLFNAAGVYQYNKRYNTNFRKYYNQLKKSSELRSEELLVKQNILLKKMINHAYKNVPYYKRLFDNHNINPNDINNPEDLKKIPYLTKKDIEENFHDLQAVNIKKKDKILHSSGGTTGRKTVFYLSKDLRWDYNFATLNMFYKWAGCDYKSKKVSIAGREVSNKFPYYLENKIENQLYIPAKHMNEKNIDVFLRKILDYGPDYINGHPSAISYFAKRIKTKKVNFNLKAIFTTSEQLFDEQRLLIEQVFQCRVYDTYGMGEMVLMGSECASHNHYHFAPEYGVIELDNSIFTKEGYGEIIGTSLRNYAMPLIRYRTGDLGKGLSHGLCQNNVPFTRLQKIIGRVDDVIYDIDNNPVLPVIIRKALSNIVSKEFQLIEKNNGEIILNLSWSEDLKSEKEITNKLYGILGKKVIVKKGEMIKTQWGKHRIVIKEKSPYKEQVNEK